MEVNTMKRYLTIEEMMKIAEVDTPEELRKLMHQAIKLKLEDDKQKEKREKH